MDINGYKVLKYSIMNQYSCIICIKICGIVHIVLDVSLS